MDQIHKRMDELHIRTDMNIKGRLIEELDQIPNIIPNITSIPKIYDRLDEIISKIDGLEDRIVKMDQRI